MSTLCSSLFSCHHQKCQESTLLLPRAAVVTEFRHEIMTRAGREASLVAVWYPRRPYGTGSLLTTSTPNNFKIEVL
jgi:hypothetical protein